MAASRVAPPTIYGQCISKIAWYVATFRATAAISSVESRPPRWQLGAEGSPGLQVAVSVVNRPASYTYIRVSYGTIGDNLHIVPKRTTSGTTKRMPQRDRQVQRDCDMRRGTARHYRDDVFVALGLSSLPARNSSSDISFSAIFGSLPRRLHALEDATSIDADLTPRVRKIGAHESADIGKLTLAIDRRNSTAQRLIGSVDSPAARMGAPFPQLP
jgi:hypothetical protein